jgi:hypothetical protein
MMVSKGTDYESDFEILAECDLATHAICRPADTAPAAHLAGREAIEKSRNEGGSHDVVDNK